jgi:hypothetical protein
MVDQMAEAHAQVELKTGSLFLFHIGGMALLTLLINAPLCAPLLSVLGIVKENKVDELVNENFADMIDEMTSDSADGVAEMVPKLAHQHSSETESLLEKDKVQSARTIFMQAVMSEYWKAIDGGELSRVSRVARVLIMVTDEALDNPGDELKDWSAAYPYLGEREVPIVSTLMARWPFKYTDLKEMCPDSKRIKGWRIQAALALIDAHKAALEKFQKHSSMLHALGDTALDVVAKESEKQRDLAQEFLSEQKPDVEVKSAKAKMVAGRLLHRELALIKQMEKDGLLTSNGATKLNHELHSHREDFHKRATADPASEKD